MSYQETTQSTYSNLKIFAHIKIFGHESFFIFILTMPSCFIISHAFIHTITTYAGSTEIKVPWGKKTRCKKTLGDDYDLGYLDFTLSVTIHSPPPQKNMVQLCQMHKK